MQVSTEGIRALSPEWFEHRRTRLSATDVPSILLAGREGEKVFKTPRQIWARITGRNVEEQADNPQLEWGRRSEAMHAAWYPDQVKEDIGQERRLVPTNRLVQHPSLDWLCCTPDGVLIGAPAIPQEDGTLLISDMERQGVWEAKAPHWTTSSDWDEGVPTAYKIQTHVQMVCTGTDWASASALIQPGIRWADIPFNQKFASAMLDRLERWWDEHIVNDTPPPITGTDRDSALLKKLHPRDNGQTAHLDSEMLAVWEALTEAKAEVKKHSAEVRLRENQLKDAIGDNTFAVLPNGEGLSYKTQTRKGYVVNDTTFRVLRKAKVQ